MFVYFRLFMFLFFTISVQSNSIDKELEVFKSAFDECIISNHTIKCIIMRAIDAFGLVSGIDTFSNMGNEDQQSIRGGKKLNDNDSLYFNYDIIRKYDLVSLVKMAYLTAENYLGPKLMTLDPNSVEGRRKQRKQQFGHILLIAAGVYALKVLTSFKIIGVISAVALVLGKMALLLNLIPYTLKGPGGGEQNTLEIVKEPVYYEDNNYFKVEDYSKGGGNYHEPAYYEYDQKNYGYKNVGYP